MLKKPFILSALLLLPISFITYQYMQNIAVQNNTENTASIETNIPVSEVTVTKDNVQMPEESNSTRKIIVHNKIEKKMLTYHKGFFSLTPNFNLSVNDQPVKQGQQLEVPVIDDKVNVTYAYDFMGHKKGKKNIVFQVPAGNEAFDITFSWK